MWVSILQIRAAADSRLKHTCIWAPSCLCVLVRCVTKIPSYSLRARWCVLVWCVTKIKRVTIKSLFACLLVCACVVRDQDQKSNHQVTLCVLVGACLCGA